MNGLRGDYVRTIERENDALRERVAFLERALGMTIETPLSFDLTATEGKIFGLLLKREFVNRSAAMDVLYGSRPNGDEADIKIIDVLICKCRSKLKPFGVAIESKWGQGYFMTPSSKSKARSFFSDKQAAA